MEKKKIKAKPTKSLCNVCGFTRPNHHSTCAWFRKDSLYTKNVCLEQTIKREEDILRQNFLAIRERRIEAEEKLLEANKKIIFLQEQNLAVGQENTNLLAANKYFCNELKEVQNIFLFRFLFRSLWEKLQKVVDATDYNSRKL